MAIGKLLKDKNKGEGPKIARRSDPPVNHDAGHDESNWLVSYADMMTLLCGFFVMLFSFAKMDEQKYEKVKEEVSKQFKGTYISPTSEVKGFVSQVLLDLGVDKNVVIKSDPTGVSVIFESVLFFETLSSEVKPEGQNILSKLIEALKAHQEKTNKRHRVVVEGHTDSRPITGGNFPSNWELSSARASGVVRLFLNHGFSPDRLIAIGYADTRPRVPPRLPNGMLDEQAFGKNRRVVLRIMEPGMEMIPLPEFEKAEPLTEVNAVIPEKVLAPADAAAVTAAGATPAQAAAAKGTAPASVSATALVAGQAPGAAAAAPTSQTPPPAIPQTPPTAPAH